TVCSFTRNGAIPSQSALLSVPGEVVSPRRSVGTEGRARGGAITDDPGGDFIRDLGVVAKILLDVFPALAEPDIAVVEPRTGLLNQLVEDGQVEQVGLTGDAVGVHHIELADPERRRNLVLDDLGLDPRADALLAVLDRPDAPDVDATGAVKLERPAAGRRLGAAEHHADFLADLVDEDQDALRTRDSAGELAQRLAHQASLDPDET